MRTALLAAFAAPMLAAQAPPTDLAGAMEQLSCATHALRRAVEAGDRSGYEQPLAAIEAQVHGLRPGIAPSEVDRHAALTAIETAVGQLRDPVGDGRASDPFDFARLRAACTSCHLASRDDNDRRGLFPNRDNAVSGRVLLEELGGARRDDAAGVVVFLEAPGLVATPMPRPQAISQRDRRFHPAALAVTTGTAVRFPNDDVVFHNVFSLSRGNAFDLGHYGTGLAKEHVFTRPGLVKVHCNIHPDMAAHVLVLDTPFAAVTTRTGAFAIGDVPDGDYTLRVFHPLADEQRRPIAVAGAEATRIDLTVRETKPRVQHPNKNGRPYPAKY